MSTNTDETIRAKIYCCLLNKGTSQEYQQDDILVDGQTVQSLEPYLFNLQSDGAIDMIRTKVSGNVVYSLAAKPNYPLKSRLLAMASATAKNGTP